MALDFNKIDEPDDSIFPVKEDDSNLDMYGVWVKKRPEHKDGYESVLPIKDDITENTLKSDFIEFDDHDIIDLDTSEDELEFEELAALNDFENVDTVEENVIAEKDITNNTGIYEDEFDIFGESDAVEIEDADKPEIEEESNLDNIDFETNIDEISIEDETLDENKTIENEVPQKNDVNDFEALDIDDFLSDNETDSPITDEKAENKDEPDNLMPENDIKLDLSFDEDYLETKESDAIDFERDDNFEITDVTGVSSGTMDEKTEIENLPEKTIEDISDFDEIFDELESNEEVEKNTPKQTNDIPLNITIDEYSDITSIAGKTMESDDDLEDVEIFSDISGFEEVEDVNNEEQNKDDGLVIENTIIEAGNIEEIRKENQKIMNNYSSSELEEHPSSELESASEVKEEKTATEEDDFDAMLDNVMGEETKDNEIQTEQNNSDMFFDDIGAFENDLLDTDTNSTKSEEDIKPELKKETEKVAVTAPSVFANDKATEILTQIASELVNIKNELATMKFEMAQTQQKIEAANIPDPGQNAAGNVSNDSKASDETGFFTDDDGDETIALTGDELNNILITADFTEENAEKDYEIPETLDEIHEVFPDDENLAEADIEDTGIEMENDDKADMAIDMSANLETETSFDNNSEVSKEEDLLSAVEPEHINDLTDDIGYLDEDIKLELENVPSLEGEDFISDETENPSEESGFEEFSNDDLSAIENFDMPITELELPDGQSIPLGDEYSDFEAITKNIEEGQDVAAVFEDTDFGNEVLEEDVLEDYTEIDEPLSDEPSDKDENEKNIFSSEELDKAAQDIPRIEFEESAAEKQQIQTETLPIHLKDEIKSVLTYMDQLLESLPEEKIEEFAKSEYFDTYKRLFDELGIS
ncbi:hypothetical protein [Treponema putidum]|uniref:hypothetical protein n=1 Tax=Treponema putidum TaxID=221027 RepID=UPI002107EBE7|nr:hypothetical protein [Treponema putidum]UTY31184.1 hypothetical protein E4N75_06340 [Treponema putidum]